MQSIRPPTLVDLAKLTTLGAIWASAFACIEIALTGFSPLAIAAWRIAIGTLALAPFAFLGQPRWPRGTHNWLLVAAAGALYNAVPFTLISWGQQHISSGMAALLMSCGPFVALALSHFLTRDDRFTLRKLAGVSLGFAGVVVLLGEQVLAGSRGGVAGQLAMVAAVTCYVLSSLIIRRISGTAPLALSVSVLATSALYMVPIAFVFSHPLPVVDDPAPVIALVFLGLVPTAAAYVLRVQIVQQLGATFLSQVSYIIPVFGLLFSWAILGQPPGITTWLALLLVLSGLLVARGGARG